MNRSDTKIRDLINTKAEPALNLSVRLGNE
jgi:hypothetical protein